MALSQWTVTVKRHPVKFGPGKDKVSTIGPDGGSSVSSLSAYINRRVKYSSVFTIENTEGPGGASYSVYLRFVPGTWSYNGTPDMSKVEHLQVFLRHKDKDYLQFEIKDGAIEVSDGSGNPVVLGPGESATVWTSIKLKPEASEGDSFNFQLELVVPPTPPAPAPAPAAPAPAPAPGPAPTPAPPTGPPTPA